MRLLRQKHHNNNYKQRNNTKNPLYIFLTKLTSFAQIMDPESGGKSLTLLILEALL